MIKTLRYVHTVPAVAAMLALLLGAMPAEAQVKLRFQTWQWNQAPTVKSLEEFQRTFDAANPGIQVVRDDSRYGDKETVYVTQSQAHAAADIAHFSYRAIPFFAERGYLLDLGPYVEKEGGAKYLAQWDPAALEMCKYRGKLYCLPDNVDPLVLMYNKVQFREAGLDPSKPPTTWAQFLDDAKKLTRDNHWGVGIIGARQEGLFMRFNPWFWGADGEYLTPDGKHSALDTSAALEGFRFYTDLFSTYHVVPPGVIEQGAQESRVQLAQGKVSMIVTLAADLNIIQALNPKMNAREVMGLAPVPAGKRKVASAWFSMRVISAFTKHPDEAWKVYKAWYGRDQQMLNFKNDGFLSARLDVRSSPEVKNDPFARVPLAEAKYVKWEPLVPEWPKIGDAVITAVQEALTGIKAPEQALKDAHAAANQALAR